MDNNEHKIHKNKAWPNCKGCDKKYLLDRISELEQRVEHLRVSRRILIDLLEKVEREKIAIKQKLKNKELKIKRSVPQYLKIIKRNESDVINYKEFDD